MGWKTLDRPSLALLKSWWPTLRISIPDPPQAQETCHTSLGCLQSKIDLMFTPSFTIWPSYPLICSHTQKEITVCGLFISYFSPSSPGLWGTTLPGHSTECNYQSQHPCPRADLFHFCFWTTPGGAESLLLILGSGFTPEEPCIMLGMEVGLGACKHMSYLSGL